MSVIYLTDSHVCLASSTAFEKIELFFRQQGWIQTDGWIKKLKKKVKKNIKIWQTLYSKLIGDSKLIEVIESNESDKFSLVSLSSSKAADDRAILLLLTDSLSKMLEWSENELKLNFFMKYGFQYVFYLNAESKHFTSLGVDGGLFEDISISVLDIDSTIFLEILSSSSISW